MGGSSTLGSSLSSWGNVHRSPGCKSNDPRTIQTKTGRSNDSCIQAAHDLGPGFLASGYVIRTVPALHE